MPTDAPAALFFKLRFIVYFKQIFHHEIYVQEIHDNLGTVSKYKFISIFVIF